MEKIVMSEKIFLPDEIDRLGDGEEIYRRKLKKKLEPKYNGKIIAIEVDSASILSVITLVKLVTRPEQCSQTKFSFSCA